MRSTFQNVCPWLRNEASRYERCQFQSYFRRVHPHPDLTPYTAVIPGRLCALPVNADLVPGCQVASVPRTPAVKPLHDGAWWANATKGLNFKRARCHQFLGVQPRLMARYHGQQTGILPGGSVQTMKVLHASSVRTAVLSRRLLAPLEGGRERRVAS